MRKYKRFIKKLTKRFFIYVVVFVALVNVCFFMPMEAQAADSIDSISTHGMYVFVGDTSIYNGPLNGESSSISVDYYTPSLITGEQYDTNGHFATSFFTIPFLFWFHEFQYDSFTVNGKLRFEFVIQWSDVPDSGSSENQSIVFQSASTTFPNINISYYFWPLSNSSSDPYSDYCRVILDLYFDDYYVSSCPSGFNVDFKFIARQFFASEVISSTLSFDISPASASYVYSDYTSFVEGFTGNDNLEYITEGYDSTSGDQVASDFESGAVSFDQAEDTLFNSADSALTGFKFFDFSTFGSITTGLSFVSGIMTSIYNNFGAMQGFGIVLSVLFSVMFMAIVIGFYRYFK